VRLNDTAGSAARRHNGRHADAAERGPSAPFPRKSASTCQSPHSGPGGTMRTYDTSTPAATHAPTAPDANVSLRYTHSAPALRMSDRCCEHLRTHLLHAGYRMCICAIHIHVYMHTRVYIFICIHVYICKCMYVCTCICVYVWMYIYVYVHVYIYICICM